MFSAVPGTKNRVFWFAVGLLSQFGEKPNGGVKRELLEAYGDWASPVVDLLDATPESEISRTPIYDRPPADHWGTARVTLAGDAAHPMVPTLGQGASTGIEDAVVLARHLTEAGSLTDSGAVGRALRAYEAERIARTSPLVKNAHRFAPIALASNPVTTRMRDALLRYSTDASWQRRFLSQHSYEP
jgi:2-polyprenyl-6-methoxyphenol hydroxylase-like FAD-dependent oxidoreductase